MLLEKEIIRDILMVTCSILKNNFFYDEDSIVRFLNIFTDELEHEYSFFDAQADNEMRSRLKYDRKARALFTTYFASVNLRETMIEFLYFTEMELEAFDNILPKYIEVADDVKSCNKRARY